MTEDNVLEILHDEIGKVCTHVLEDSGVFKLDDKGKDGFCKFLAGVGYERIN